MTAPSAEDLERGHTVLAPAPFADDEERTRAWVVVNNERHPSDKEQYIVTALTTRTWYEERIQPRETDYRHRRASRESSIVPHAVASLRPEFVTDYVCRIRDEPLDRAVDTLVDSLRGSPRGCSPTETGTLVERARQARV